jgi:hypothetical protein
MKAAARWYVIEIVYPEARFGGSARQDLPSTDAMPAGATEDAHLK